MEFLPLRRRRFLRAKRPHRRRARRNGCFRMLLFLLFLPCLFLNPFTQQEKFLLPLRFLRNLLFLLKLRKQFASKFLRTRSILDISDVKGNLFVFVLAAPACSKRSVGEDGIKKSDGVGAGRERVKFPYKPV